MSEETSYSMKELLDVVGKKVTIRGIDMYGFCGREFHPKENLNGMEGRIVGIASFEEVGESEFYPFREFLLEDLPNNDSGLIDFDQWTVFFYVEVGGEVFELYPEEFEGVFE